MRVHTVKTVCYRYNRSKERAAARRIEKRTCAALRESNAQPSSLQCERSFLGPCLHCTDRVADALASPRLRGCSFFLFLLLFLFLRSLVDVDVPATGSVGFASRRGVSALHQLTHTSKLTHTRGDASPLLGSTSVWPCVRVRVETGSRAALSAQARAASALGHPRSCPSALRFQQLPSAVCVRTLWSRVGCYRYVGVQRAVQEDSPIHIYDIYIVHTYTLYNIHTRTE